MSNVFKKIGKTIEKGGKSMLDVGKKATKGAQRAAASTDRFINTAQTSGLGAAAKGAKRDIKSDYKANDRDIRDARDTYRDAVGTGIDAYQAGVEKQLQNDKHATGGIMRKIGVSDNGIRSIQDIPDALASLSAGDARLLNATKNTQSGVFNKNDRIDATKKDAQGLQYVKTIGGAVGATQIPIVSWIGRAANLIANQRLAEADLQTDKQALTSVGLMAAPAIGGAIGGTTGAMVGGGLGGGIAAKASGTDVGKGVVLGAVGSGAGGLGQGIGGALGETVGRVAGGAVGGALGSGAAAYGAGARGDDLWQSALGGAVSGGYGASAGNLGWDPRVTSAVGGAIQGGLKGGSEGAIYGALGGGLNASGTAGKVANTLLQQQRNQQQRNQQLAKARATQRTSTSPYAAGRV